MKILVLSTHVWYHNILIPELYMCLNPTIWSKHIFGYSWDSSTIFTEKSLENFRKICLEMFASVWPVENFERIFENLWKLSKLLILVCLVCLCIVGVWLKGNSMVSWRKFFFLGWKICFNTREVSYLWLQWPFNIYI